MVIVLTRSVVIYVVIRSWFRLLVVIGLIDLLVAVHSNLAVDQIPLRDNSAISLHAFGIRRYLVFTIFLSKQRTSNATENCGDNADIRRLKAT